MCANLSVLGQLFGKFIVVCSIFVASPQTCTRVSDLHFCWVLWAFFIFQMSRLTFSSRSVVCPSRPASGGDYSPVLDGRDGASRSIITHAAPHHGADLSCTARDSNRLGHCGRVALRGDQEPALVIFREVAARRDPLRLRNHRQTVGIGEKISV